MQNFQLSSWHQSKKDSKDQELSPLADFFKTFLKLVLYIETRETVDQCQVTLMEFPTIPRITEVPVNKLPGGHDDDLAIKLFLCSTQLSMKFILLINAKMPTIVGILTFISRINTSYESLKARNTYLYQYFSFYEQLKFHAQLS